MVTTPTEPTKADVGSRIWENIYDRLNDDVSSVTITGSNVITIQNYTNSFPESSLSQKADYPILVLNSIDMDWERFTFKKQTVNGSFAVDIYTTQSESADKFLDAIINSIETYRTKLSAVKITNVKLDSTETDQAEVGKINVHRRTCIFTFKFRFVESQVF